MLKALLIAVLTSLEPGGEEVASFHAEAAATAWNRGDLAQAGEHAVQAYDALAQGGCLATADGARLAFMAGVASHADQIDGFSGYYFWAARQLDRAAGGLAAAEREVSRRLGSEPGRRPNQDWRYIGSPLMTNPNPRRARRCESILPELHPDPPVKDAVLVIAWAAYPDGQYTRVQTVYAYPDAAGRVLAEQLRGTYNRFQTAPRRVLHEFVFSPCYTAYDAARAPVDICLSAAPAP